MALWLVREVPAWLVGMVLVVGLPLLMLGLDRVLHRRVTHQRLDHHNIVTGVIVSVVGIAYGVIMGLSVVSLWEAYTDDEETSRAEATTVSALVPASVVFGPEFQRQLTDNVIDYERDVIAHWHDRAEGKANPWVNADLAQLATLINGLEPRTDTQRAFIDDAVERLAQAQELRQQSLSQADDQKMAPVIWVGVLIGTVAILALLLLFGIDDNLVRRWLLIAATVVVATNLFLVLEMNYPFHGSYAVQPTAYEDVIRQLGGVP